jgi:hypothetical protein
MCDANLFTSISTHSLTPRPPPNITQHIHNGRDNPPAFLFPSKSLSAHVDCHMSLPKAHKGLIQAIACVLADQQYQNHRWFGLDELSQFCNAFTQRGKPIGRNTDTAENAFKITGGLFYAEYPFSVDLLKDIGPDWHENIVSSVRRLRKPGKGGNHFTVVGCFYRDS